MDKQFKEWWEKASKMLKCDQYDAYEIWQQAKKVAVPEGFVLVPREPIAYKIKHRLWSEDSEPEIYLAQDFIGDNGVEKHKLTVCIPLYAGQDEAQEQENEPR